MRLWAPLCVVVVTLLSLRSWSADRPPDISRLLKHASTGDIDAQFLLGLAYDTGAGVTQNSGEAAHWYQKAADVGHPGAQTKLETCTPKAKA